MEVIERDDAIVVRAELPGVTKADIDVSLTDDSITIKAETSHKSKNEEGDYHRSEIERSLFSRTLALPGSVDEEKAEARFHNGVLELTLPKREQAKRRRIEVA